MIQKAVIMKHASLIELKRQNVNFNTQEACNFNNETKHNHIKYLVNI